VTGQLADQPARDRIRTDLDTTLVVEAASGTGKTSELVGRIVATLKAGRAHLDAMVAVTFTEAAAGELKLRLRGAIEEARQDRACAPDVRERLTATLPQLEEARIGTIHSFCADLLRERPVQAGVDPLFEVASDDVSRPLFERAFDRWFETQLASPGEAVRRILRRRGHRFRDAGPRDVLRSAAWDLVEQRDFQTPWRYPDAFDRDAAIDAMMDEMVELGQAARGGAPEDYFTKSLEAIGRFAGEITRREAVRGRDYDGLEAALTQFRRESHWRWTGFRSAPADFPKGELKARRDVLKVTLDDFVAASGADLAPRLRDELWPVVLDYEHLKGRAGCLDFLDLLLRARDLVRDDARVRGQLQQRFTHLFVDEFQDTDPLQAEILLLLAADDPSEREWRRVRPVPGKLFLVGDPKQSIYRFRRADVALYESVKRQLADGGAAVVDLSVSFRAVPGIQEAVNAAFAPLMGSPTGAGDRSAGQPRYVPLSPFRPELSGQPAVIALPVPAPYGDYKRVVNWRIEESLPDAVAAFIDWLVRESGWTVTDRERPDQPVPVEARHVCLLFKRFRSVFGDWTRPYVRALEARHLSHILVGGSSFHLREEVEAIRNALGAIERPDDELALFATLRGPLFALGDEALLGFRHRCRSLHPFRELPADLPAALAEVADALALLRTLHRGRNRRPIADTIGRLLAATRAHGGLAIWPTGEQALANVTRLMDMARRAERSGVMSFRGFVDRLEEQAERGEAGDAPIVEEGAEGVRLMTVHRAKGLEFPVVVLCDLTATAAPSEPRRWVDAERGVCTIRLADCAPPELAEHAAEALAAERDEGTRVLYVAATRARDLLVVPAVGDQRQEGWLSALSPVVYPPDDECRRPETRRPDGCPQLGEDSALKRAPGVRRPVTSVVPGLHRPEAGSHRVVWWDPRVLALGVEESVGLSQQKLLQADESGTRSDEGIRAHADWQAGRQRVRDVAEVPRLRIVTATALAATAAGLSDEPSRRSDTLDAMAKLLPADVGTDITLECVDRSAAERRDRPQGKRFGTLVHEVLATVDLGAKAPDAEVAARWHGRILAASEAEIVAAVATVVRALEHPLLRRAAAAARNGRCRRESPVATTLEDGTIIEGIVDAVFYEDDPEPVWTVVDFKTDAEIGTRLEEYRKQVGLYGLAVARATGVTVRGVVLQV
jgi:ATP-dependent helicase/nuclease subunit A